MVVRISTLSLKKWNPKSLKTHSGSTSLIIGKRAVGKTTLAKNLAEQLIQEETKVLVFAPVGSHNQSDYALIFGANSHIHEKYDYELIKDHMNEKGRLRGVAAGEGLTLEESIILIDDLYTAKMRQTGDNFSCILMNGRNLKIHLVMTQQTLDLTPMMRTNIDYVFIFKENNENNKRKLYNCYAGMFPNYTLFTKVLDEVTKNYGCMVIDNTSRSDQLTDQVFWYEVPLAG